MVLLLDSDLKFAFCFPFSSRAKYIVKNNISSLDDVSEQIFFRAKSYLHLSFFNEYRKKGFVFPSVPSNPDMLLEDVLSFPVAKILVSFSKDSSFHKSFARLYSEYFLHFFNNLDSDSQLSVLFELSKNFNISPKLIDLDLISVSLEDYLSLSFYPDYLKLINQDVSDGVVFFSVKKFSIFVSELIFSFIFYSLPVPLDSVPKKFSVFAKSVLNEFSNIRANQIEFSAIGVIKPEAFPPCMKQMYDSLLSGANLSHLERFDIATFLVELGMSQEKVIELFSKQPNFDRDTTTYQVSRLIEKKISSPSCAKLKEQGFACLDCSSVHPISAYKKNLKFSKYSDKNSKKTSS